ncbi:hypothetical protein SLEP1_g58983 [Rubroshorea leprosula]|uniref:GATA transcription factor 25-like n=1 Tax=Rubroshorea leprosula TaxID=152421 RepID=A0AAV5MU86_9ROSI|nr:hypothetical protein SLEP1_g58983 [Rubroshorea leprosula]
MYAHSQPMNLPSQIPSSSAAEPDDDDSSASPVPDSHHHIPYDPQTDAVLVEGVGSDSIYVTDAGGPDLTVQRADGSSQLTLSYRGQFYVFDAISPDKLQSVLLLLGGCELASNSHEVTPLNQRGVVDFPGRCNQPQRAASLSRFRQKRKERCFDKKVRYSVRQEVALRMQRNKGQFTSSKKPEGSYNWGSGQDLGQDDGMTETSCTHCGVSSKSTPMMRRGPSGPRSLCNACGLFWANKGTLRDLSKKNHDHSITPIEQGDSEANDSDCGTSIHTNDNLVPFSNGDNSALMAEH